MILMKIAEIVPSGQILEVVALEDENVLFIKFRRDMICFLIFTQKCTKIKKK